MTDLVIRTLDESDAHLFDTLPDALGARAQHRLTTWRPDRQRVALRDGTVVARAAWWGGPNDTEPLAVDCFDLIEGEEEAGAELLRSAPWRVDVELNLPAGWRDNPENRAAAEARFTALRAAGYDLLVERFIYRWTPECGLPERPGRLVFAPEPDDAVFFDALRRIHSVTLDAHAQRAIREGELTRPRRRRSTSSAGARPRASGGRSPAPPRETSRASTFRPTTRRAPASASSESYRNSAATATPATCSPSAPTTSWNGAPSSSPRPRTRATSRWPRTSRRSAIRSSVSGPASISSSRRVGASIRRSVGP